MSCDIYSKLMIKDEYILGQLSDAEKETFEKHFFECDTCFKELKLQQEMLQLIKEKGGVLFAEYLRTEEKSAKNRVPESVKAFRSPRFIKQFKPFYAMAVILLIMTGSFYATKNFFQKDMLSTIVFDNQVPIEYIPELVPTFRGGETQTPGNTFDSFYEQFNTVMLTYKDKNYSQTIKLLKFLQPEVEKLQEVIDGKKFSSAMNNYYFYLGVSYLAAAQSEKNVLTDSIKNIHLRSAIQHLTKSKTTGLIIGKPNVNNKTSYFLGLSYILAGDRQKGISELQKIEKTSAFFKNGEDLSNYIRKQQK